MQKVSKQSLAMIALSILLAISIALTFTFAVLSDKQGAVGTVTFSEGFTLTAGTGLTAQVSDDGGYGATYTFTIEPTYANDAITYSVTDSSNCYWQITNKNNANLLVEFTTKFTSPEVNTEHLNGMADPISASDKIGMFKKNFSTKNESIKIEIKNLLIMKGTTFADVEKMKTKSLIYTLEIDVHSVSTSNAADW